MNLLNAIIALTMLALMSFGLLKTIDLSECRHEMISKGFWEATSIIVSHSSSKTRMSFVCRSILFIEVENRGITVSQSNLSYSLQLSNDINSKELE